MNENPNPERCGNCNATWKQCNASIVNRGRACCEACAQTVMHDQDAKPKAKAVKKQCSCEVKIAAVEQVIHAAREGEYATKGMDFGRGVAHLAALIEEVLA